MSANSNNVTDYVVNHGNRNFEEEPFNEMDGLIFSELSYVHFENISNMPSEVSVAKFAELALAYFDQYNDTHPDYLNDDFRALLETLMTSDRYSNCTISDMEEVFEAGRGEMTKIHTDGTPVDGEQWAAMTIHIRDKGNTEDQASVVAFRGTNGGTGLSWQEDFEMAYSIETDAQKSSADYLRRMMEKYSTSEFILAGHSKGGNNAIYAYLAVVERATRERIRAIYDYDGPGVMGENAVRYAEAYSELGDKLYIYAPQDSIIGQLLIHNFKELHFVYSNSDNIGWEHDGFTWQMNEDGNGFQFTDRSAMSLFVDRMLDETMMSLTEEERENVISVLIKIGVFEMIEGDRDNLIGEVLDDVKLMQILNIVLTIAQQSEAKVVVDGVVVADIIIKMLNEYYSLTPEEQQAFLKAVSVVIFSAEYNFDVWANAALDEAIDKINEAEMKCIHKIDEISIAMEMVLIRYDSCASIYVPILHAIAKGLVLAVMETAKLAANLLKKVVNIGKRSAIYSKDEIYLDGDVLDNIVTQLNAAQKIVYGLDKKLNDLRDALSVFEVVDQATAASVDFQMTGSNLYQNTLEHIFTKGYDWEITKCINYLTSVKSQMTQNECFLQAKAQF